jgi:putative transposase
LPENIAVDRQHTVGQHNPTPRCARAPCDAVLEPHIERIWQANLQVYCADEV